MQSSDGVRQGTSERADATASSETVARLRTAAWVCRTTGDARPLYEAARAFASEGAGRGFRAEQLIVEFKRVWRTIPEARALRDGPRPVVDELVSLCIAECYRPRSGAAGSAGAA